MHRLVWSNITYRTVNTIFVCATYSSIYLLSSQYYVTLCEVLFLQVFFSCSNSLLSMHRYCDFVLQSYKINVFTNALLCTLLLSVSIHQGLNVTYLMNLIQVRCNSSTNKQNQLINNALSGQVSYNLGCSLYYFKIYHRFNRYKSGFNKMKCSLIYDVYIRRRSAEHIGSYFRIICLENEMFYRIFIPKGVGHNWSVHLCQGIAHH